jgi:hypothetical protein
LGDLSISDSKLKNFDSSGLLEIYGKAISPIQRYQYDSYTQCIFTKGGHGEAFFEEKKKGGGDSIYKIK